MFCLFNWKIIVLISETRRIYQRRLEKTGTGSFQCRGVSGTVDIFLTLLLVGIIIVPYHLKRDFSFNNQIEAKCMNHIAVVYRTIYF